MKLFLNCENNDITFNKKNYLIRAAERLGVDWVSEEPNSEYVLNIEPYNFVKGEKWTGVWEIDTLLNLDRIKNYWSSADDIFIAGSSKFIYPRDNIHILFQACDPVLHKPVKGEKEVDFCFAGSLGHPIYEERERIHELLRKNGVTILGAGKNHKPFDYVRELNRGRIQFIRSMDVNGEGEIAQRFFECLAIGPVVTNHVPDLKETGLLEGIDYLSYSSDDEMLEKVKLLLDNEKMREEVANNGRQKALLMHTYEHRLVSIFNKIKEKTNG